MNRYFDDDIQTVIRSVRESSSAYSTNTLAIVLMLAMICTELRKLNRSNSDANSETK